LKTAVKEFQYRIPSRGSVQFPSADQIDSFKRAAMALDLSYLEEEFSKSIKSLHDQPGSNVLGDILYDEGLIEAMGPEEMCTPLQAIIHAAKIGYPFHGVTKI